MSGCRDSPSSEISREYTEKFLLRSLGLQKSKIVYFLEVPFESLRAFNTKQKTGILINTCFLFYVGVQGFEPCLNAPKALVLAVDTTPRLRPP